MRNVIFLLFVCITVCALIVSHGADRRAWHLFTPSHEPMRALSGERDKENYVQALQSRLARWNRRLAEYAEETAKSPDPLEVSRRAQKVANWNRKLRELDMDLVALREESGEVWEELRIRTEAKTDAFRDSFATGLAE